MVTTEVTVSLKLVLVELCKFQSGGSVIWVLCRDIKVMCYLLNSSNWIRIQSFAFLFTSLLKSENHILRHITRSIKVNGVSSVIERQSCLVPVRDTRQHHFSGRSFKLCRSGVNSICGLRAPFIIYSN